MFAVELFAGWVIFLQFFEARFAVRVLGSGLLLVAVEGFKIPGWR